MKWDVVAVNQTTKRVRIFARNEDLRNADAVVSMAVARRGVDEEFYTIVAAGLYDEGDEYGLMQG